MHFQDDEGQNREDKLVSIRAISESQTSVAALEVGNTQLMCDYSWNLSYTKLIKTRDKDDFIDFDGDSNFCKLGTKHESQNESLFIRQPSSGIYTKDIALSRPRLSGENSKPSENKSDFVWNRSQNRLVKRNQVMNKPDKREDIIEDNASKLNPLTVSLDIEEAEYKCRLCDAIFPKYLILARHLKTAYNEVPEKGVLCYFCAKTFTNLKYVTTHVRLMHQERQNIICDICSAEVTNISEHILVHQAPQLACEYCGKQFRRNQEVKFHVKSVHAKLAPEGLFHCEVCGKTICPCGLFKKTYAKTYTRT